MLHCSFPNSSYISLCNFPKNFLGRNIKEILGNFPECYKADIFGSWGSPDDNFLHPPGCLWDDVVSFSIFLRISEAHETNLWECIFFSEFYYRFWKTYLSYIINILFVEEFLPFNKVKIFLNLNTWK